MKANNFATPGEYLYMQKVKLAVFKRRKVENF